jgi:putative tryptophan/tyrosine transport system substrate-binding protein
MPLAAGAQEKTMPVIGFLGGATLGTNASVVAAFRLGLSETGYAEGQNVVIDFRWAERRYDRLPSLAADLVARKVDLIAAFDIASARAAKRETRSIPIVFVVGGDPVAAGLVTNLPRPDGNLTGVSFVSTELMPKRLQLLSELAPQAKVFALLVNPRSPNTELMMRNVPDIARAKGLQLHILKASSGGEIDDAFATLMQFRAGALIVGTDALFFSERDRLAALALHHAVPAIYDTREFAAAGGLISYGPSLTGTNREFGIYVGRILKGAKPADLPVQLPTTFELVINLKTAKAIGIAVPQILLAEAVEVIE